MSFVFLKENELDRYIIYCDGKGDSDNFLESHPTDFFKVGFENLMSFCLHFKKPFLATVLSSLLNWQFQDPD